MEGRGGEGYLCGRRMEEWVIVGKVRWGQCGWRGENQHGGGREVSVREERRRGQ